MKFCLIRKKSSSVRIYFDLKAFFNVNTSGIEARVLERNSGTRKFFSRSHRKPFISKVSIIPDDKENVRSKETNDSSIKMNYNESLDYSIYNDSHWLHILSSNRNTKTIPRSPSIGPDFKSTVYYVANREYVQLRRRIQTPTRRILRQWAADCARSPSAVGAHCAPPCTSHG